MRGAAVLRTGTFAKAVQDSSLEVLARGAVRASAALPEAVSRSVRWYIRGNDRAGSYDGQAGTAPLGEHGRFGYRRTGAEVAQGVCKEMTTPWSPRPLCAVVLRCVR